MSGEDELYRELAGLRRGRGVHEPGLAGRLGPRLRELTGVAPGEADAVARDRLRAALRGLLRDLPADLVSAAVHALALGDSPPARLTRRVENLATAIHSSDRTARRRIDDAARLIARAAYGHTEPEVVPGVETDPGPGWRVRSFTALLRLDTPAPELYETRIVQADRKLAELTVRLDLPPRPDADGPARPLAVEAVYGAVVTDVDSGPDGRHYTITIALPRVLEPPEKLEFCLHYRVPDAQPIRHHCAIVPLEECDQGRIRVRFDRAAPPATVWRFAAVAPRQMDTVTAVPGPDRLEPDGAGEVHVAFGGLRQGHGYGVAWRPTGARR